MNTQSKIKEKINAIISQGMIYFAIYAVCASLYLGRRMQRADANLMQSQDNLIYLSPTKPVVNPTTLLFNSGNKNGKPTRIPTKKVRRQYIVLSKDDEKSSN